MDKYKNKSQTGREMCCNFRRKGENKVKLSESYRICAIFQPAEVKHALNSEISRTSNISIKILPCIG